jgi:hypothetical protein
MQDQMKIFEKRLERQQKELKFFIPDQSRTSPEPPRSPKAMSLRRYHPPVPSKVYQTNIPHGVSDYDTLAASGITLSQAALDATPMTPDSPIASRRVDVPNTKKLKRKKQPKPTSPLKTIAISGPPSLKECPIPPAFTDTSSLRKTPGPVLQGKFNSPPSEQYVPPAPAHLKNPGNPYEIIVIPRPPGSTVNRTSSFIPRDSPLTRQDESETNASTSSLNRDKSLLKDALIAENDREIPDKHTTFEAEASPIPLNKEPVMTGGSETCEQRSNYLSLCAPKVPDADGNQLETACTPDASLLNPTAPCLEEEVVRRRAYFAQRIAESRQRALEWSRHIKQRTDDSVSESTDPQDDLHLNKS